MEATLLVFDANILIDADKLQLGPALTRLKVAKRVTDLCWSECNSVKGIALGTGPYALQQVETTPQFDEICAYPIAQGCSVYDRSALWLAESLSGTLLTSDRLLRAEAERRQCKVHGLLGLIKQLWSTGVIDKTMALQRLNKLKETGQGFRIPIDKVDHLIHEITSHN
jgi:hypothetical protein